MALQTHPLETADARKARHFDTLRRLGALAMDLAQDAHALAKQQLAPPPCSLRPRPAGLPANVAATIDYARTFAVLSRAVRQAIALEMRREAEPRTRPSFRPLGAPPGSIIDPRRDLLRTVFHAAVAADPDRARLRREIDQHVDHQLEADPDQRRPIEEIVDDLVKFLGIDLDPAQVPDALLGIPKRSFAEARASP